jgi:two-component sensor histidine kinase
MVDREEMVRRQEVLGRFGETALRSDDTQEILTEACRLIAEALGVELAKVLEVDRPANEALVRAGVGWAPGVVGTVRVPLGVRSSEAYAIETAQPVVTRNLAEETRFEFPAFMRDAGVVALVNVPIFVPGGEPYGLLQVDSRQPREFGEEDVAFLKTYATILGPVIDRLHKVNDLRAARDRSDMLLRELQHRVKNDLLIIKSLIRLRAKAGTPEVQRELQIIEDRLETLRLVHEQLYEGELTGRLALRPYVERLVGNLRHLRGASGDDVAVHLDVAEMEVSPDIAAPLGLIINEFVTNSFKYAFNGSGGLLTVRVSSPGDGRARLFMSDSGPGFPTARVPARSGKGMSLIEGLARQLNGTPTWATAGGAQFQSEFDLQ